MARAVSRVKHNLAPPFAEQSLFTAGYHNKLLQEELPAGASTGDSFNFILDKDGKWTTRSGTKYLGSLSSDTGGCSSSAVLLRRDGVELPVKFYGTLAYYFNPDMLDWELLLSGLTANQIFGRCVMYKVTDNVNKLEFCNGTDPYYIWTGVTGTVASFTGATIVLNGAVALSDMGFTATGNIVVHGVAYAYTGLSGQTFTGVTPDPTVSGTVAGQAVTQQPVAYASNPNGNVMIAYNGRVVMSTKPTSALYGGGSYVGSKLNDPTDFTFGATRAASEGYQLIMSDGGGNINGMVSFEGGVAIFKQSACSIHIVSDDQNDFPSQSPLLPADSSASGTVGNVGPKACFVLGSQVFFVSPRKIISSLQRISQLDFPTALPFSDRIDNVVQAMTWDVDTNGIGYNDFAIISGKADSTSTYPDKHLRYNQRFDAWDTPLIGVGISSYFVYKGDLYATLATSPDVVKMFTGTTDFATSIANGQKINAKLTLGRETYGKKGSLKKAQNFFVAGWMSLGGTLKVTLFLNETGQSVSGTITGDQSRYFFTPASTGSFGTETFGVDTFGGGFQKTTETPSGIGLFRICFNFRVPSFWNVQPVYETSDYFKLISHGADVQSSNAGIPPTLKASMNS